MIGILLVNLGTPSEPTAPAVRKYLAEFLWDPRVVAIPRLLWWLILHGLVLPLRSSRSAQLYKKIWMADGSPLLIYSQKLTEKLQLKLGDTAKVVLGMRYGKPAIAEALEELRQHKVEKILVLPLYPQYSEVTTASSFDAVKQVFQSWGVEPEFYFLQHYFNNADYITAIANSIRAHQEVYGDDSHLLFSFHGLPQRCVDLGDPYQKQCETTARLVAEKLQLPTEKYDVVFQSRFGRTKWIQPYCDEALRHLPTVGKTNVTLICPGFAVDCLETLEEIKQQNRELFLNAGGESFHYIPALNDSDVHVAMFEKMVRDRLF